MDRMILKRLALGLTALSGFLLTAALPHFSVAACDADSALKTDQRLSVEDTLADQLSHWVEKYGRAPRITSLDRDERISARIWFVSRSLSRISQALSPTALTILGTAKPPRDIRPYDTVPLQKRFKGENLGIDIWSDRAQKIIHFETHYLHTQSERAPFEITIRDGLLYDAQGKLYDTLDGDLKGLSNSKGKAMAVMSAGGTIYSSKDQELGRLHHSTLIGGEPVAAAFEWVVKNGVITEIKNLSGHYLPPTELYAQLLDWLIQGGANVAAIDLQAVAVSAPLISEITKPLFGLGSATENLTSTFHQAKLFMDLTSYPVLLDSLLNKAAPASKSVVEKAVTAIDHVGFLVPAGTTIEMLEEAARENGFTEGQRSFASVIVAKELGVPTQIFICKEKLASGDFRAIEVFIPSGDAATIKPWIEEGIGTHVAFRASSNEGIEDIKDRLSADGYSMPSFMNHQAMANAQQGSLTIYFDLQRGPQKLRMEFVHTK